MSIPCYKHQTLHAAARNSHNMSWTDTLVFFLGYLLTPALAIGAAALVIHLILLIKSYRTERAIRADSLSTSA